VRGRRLETVSRSDDVRLTAPIVPRNFFHTAGNFREQMPSSRGRSTSRMTSHLDRLLQNTGAIVGPEAPVVYPSHLTRDSITRSRSPSSSASRGSTSVPTRPRNTCGYTIFNDITRATSSDVR